MLTYIQMQLKFSASFKYNVLLFAVYISVYHHTYSDYHTWSALYVDMAKSSTRINRMIKQKLYLL